MAVNYFSTSLQDMLVDKSFRLDYNYRYISDNKRFTIFNSSNLIPLNKILYPCLSKNIHKGELEKDYYLIDLNNIGRCSNELLDLQLVDVIGSDKSLLKEGDIIIPKIEPQKGQLFLNIEHNEYLGSTELIEYKINENYNPYYVYYLLVSKTILSYLKYLESGKTHRRVNVEDLLKIKIPNIPLSQQNAIVERIKPLEEEIKQLKQSKEEHIKIINNVFGAYFGFNWEDCDNFGKGMTAGTQKYKTREKTTFANSLNIFANPLLRFSCRYSNPQTQKCTSLLFSRPTKKIKDITKQIIKGIQPDYTDDGEIPVIKIANMKNSYIELATPEYVSSEFFNSLDESKHLHKDDILICCTGKISLGKIDIVTQDIDAVLSVDSYCLRLKNNYNKDFLVYFLRSLLGTFQFERDFTGTTNQIHLYDRDILNFDIPDISLTEQERIVKEIKTQLNKQEERNKQITNKQKQISQIVEDSLK